MRRELAKLEAMAFDAELTRLGETRSMVRRLVAELAQIDDRARDALLGEQSFAARTLGVSARWQTHLSQRRQALMQKIALARAEEAEQQLKTRRAFGRKTASEAQALAHEAALERDAARRDAERLDDCVMQALARRLDGRFP